MPLDDIRKGRRSSPPRLLIYGTEGIGKSTLAAQAPKPIFIPTEDGLDQIDCHSFPVANEYGDVVQALTTLYADKHDYQTVVLDSLDWLERLVWDAVCKRFGSRHIEQVDKGFGRGYSHALTEWQEVIAGLNALRIDHGMAVIMLAHSKVEKFEDPESVTYDRYAPRLHKTVCSFVTEWACAVLFAGRKVITKTEETGFGRERSIAAGLGRDGGDRILKCIGSPSCIAKNRYGMPAELPLSWQAVEPYLLNPNQEVATDGNH